LTFKENSFEISGGETFFIGLQFQPAGLFGPHQILVFLNEVELDKTEECISITANYAEE
jgi:nephrocystin-4